MMMNLDGARAGGEGFASVKKPQVKKKTSPTTGVTEPVFESQEKPLNIEVPEGWKAVES